ncbi:hypothetical protein PTSG_12702 [Salpingoeca rosetta]|uniref:Uncharacterized protein n=1 Tax=Salpingoeca rosetta (strain ATCC 50818 / BSB-021) TaxID=946362 RepID=F2UJ79_SALR5|nr:hypothetical protein PTSG_12702 [Salpingoeca rosetta]|eukprot:XP_004990522.1 hypothetical protein PTSG_12702 [Salpingoeca rosetta]
MRGRPCAWRICFFMFLSHAGLRNLSMRWLCYVVFGMGAVFGIVLRRLLFWDEERLVLSLVAVDRVCAGGVGNVALAAWRTPPGRCWRQGCKRPVLKHGPRSLTCARVF